MNCKRAKKEEKERIRRSRIEITKKGEKSKLTVQFRVFFSNALFFERQSCQAQKQQRSSC